MNLTENIENTEMNEANPQGQGSQEPVSAPEPVSVQEPVSAPEPVSVQEPVLSQEFAFIPEFVSAGEPEVRSQKQPGQFQTGQIQPGQFQTGQIQPGQFQTGQIQPGQFQSGQYQPGQFQTSQIQPGQFQTGQYQSGQFQTGQIQPGRVQANRVERKGVPARTSRVAAKKRKGIDRRTLFILLGFFVAVFLFVFVIGTRTDEKTGKTVTIAQYAYGEFSQKTIFGEPEERLSEDMEPIAIDEDSPFYEQFKSADRVNVLLLGVNANMTDTIMLGSYDMANQNVDIISIPRDTYYYRDGYGEFTAWQKLNSYYHSEGVASLARACSDLLCGMPIHYYVIVEYDDIKAVMKELGGVKINIPFYMKYDDTTPGYEFHVDIPAGEQMIDETNVIQFLRFRHTNPYYAAQGYKSYSQGDIQRIQVQQSFVKTVIKAILERGKLTDIIQVVLENVESDLTLGTALQVAAKLPGFDMENLQSYTLPGIDFVNTLSFWRADRAETEVMLGQIYGVDTVMDPEEEAAPVVIEPGSRIRFVGIPEYEEDGE